MANVFRPLALVVAAFLTCGAQTVPKPPPPADLSEVTSVLKDPAATEAQRQRLVGKNYAGRVRVVAVRISSTDPSIGFLEVQADEADAAVASIRLRFEVRTDDERVQRLTRNQLVRVSGTLTSASASPKLAVFADTAIETTADSRPGLSSRARGVGP